MIDARPGYLPVHCCCHPDTRLGWVRLALPVREGLRVVFVRERHTITVEDLATMIDARDCRLPVIETRVDWLTQYAPWRCFLAVKSAHLPVEVWREVPGFVDELPMEP